MNGCTADGAALGACGLGNRLDAAQKAATPAPSTTLGSVFMFQRRRVPINWRHLAGLDIDRVSREVDIQALQQNISNVTFCDVGSEDFRGVDGNFIKLFRLAQLTIEYLLHSQQYLSDQKNQLEQQVQQLQKEVEASQTEAKAKIEEMKTVKRENRKRRKMIEAYQDMLNHGATGLHPCPVCSKEFVSQQYLDSHIHRRHPNHLPPTPAPTTQQGPSQEEIEKKVMEQMNEKFHTAQQQLQEELARKENESLRTQAVEFEQWKAAQQEKRKSELGEMQTPLLQQLKTVEQEKDQLQKVLLKTQAEIEAMKSLVQSLHSENPLAAGRTNHHQTVPETITEDTDSAPAAAEDIKRLETKVVSKWKKHKMSVHRQIEEMNKSYQDQLLEISNKLANMEQSAKAQQLPGAHKRVGKGRQKEHKREEELVEKEPPPSTAQPMQTVQPVLPVDESQSDEISESSEEEEESEEHSSEEVSDHKKTHFTPFRHSTTITTLYNHGPEAMDKIRRETASILENALIQRGVSKGTVGLSDAVFQSKLKHLNMERQQRVQMHSQFMEQRQRLANEVEMSAKANCFTQSPEDHFPSSPPPSSPTSTRRSSPHRAVSPLRTPPHQKTSPHRGSPQRTSPSRELASSTGLVSRKPPTGLPPQTQPAHLQQRSGLQTGRELSGSETETESDSESYEEEDTDAAGAMGGLPESGRRAGGQERGKRQGRQEDGGPRSKIPAGAVRVLPSMGGREKEGEGRELGEEEESTTWDSEESNDNLTTQDLMSLPTSTPIQVLPVKKAKASKVDHDPQQEASSDNSWDVTEISSESRPHPKRALAGPSQGRHMKLASTHSGNSQSALTTVSRGDFDDSDLSDISTTQLT